MRVSFVKPYKFVCVCDYSERETPWRAGFHWDSEEKHWYTTSFEHASRLRDHFDTPLKRLVDRASVIETPWSGRVFTKGKLLPHQLRGLKFAMTRNHSYMAFDMGLGKTAIGVEVMNQHKGDGRPSLAIVPPFLVTNWITELKKWSTDLKVQVVRKGGAFDLDEGTDVLIVPDSLFPNAGTKKSLMRLKYAAIIVDEAHRFLTKESKRTKFLFGESLGSGLVHRGDRVCLLSGTPMRKGPMELYPTLKALAWNEIGFRTMHKYGLDFCDAYEETIFRGRKAWNYSGESNLEILRDLIVGSFFLREELTDNVKSLEGKLEERVVELEADSGDVVSVEKLERVSHDSSLSLKEVIEDYAGGEYDASQISTYRRELSAFKVRPAARHIKKVLKLTDESVLVFVHHVDTAAKLKDVLGLYGPRVIIGGVKNTERDEIEKEFQAGRRRVIIANIQTMVGLNLTRATRCIFVESSWSSTENDQARSRAFRIGQDKKVLVEHLVLANTIDAYVLNTVIKKRRTINKLF